MAAKKFTEKIGREGLVDFDPVNGIMKYGSYEVFAKDLGITPARHEITFDDYLEASKPKFGPATLAVMPRTKAATDKLRAQFEADLASGVFGPVEHKPTDLSSRFSSDVPRFGFTNNPAEDSLLKISKPLGGPTTFRNVQKLGPDSFAVEVYDFANDQYDLANKIGERASGLRAGYDDAALKQNQSDALSRRKGRASTVLNKTGA
jgi:hypothetical protein